MRSEVMVEFGPEEQFHLGLDGVAPMGSEEARRWLDEQFVALDCEPLRATGKVLLADKVLAVASAAGVENFANPAWAQAFARAVEGALQKPLVRVDVPGVTVAY
ncbi:hypothetical protein [Caldimonas tepidiphila]|uniref:hypothetical protein n=1 Tax=Caldimonas tepidiphila TaxID=2315841 RepID=UPI000E5BE52D|nr:hypothetical protein [Caldimonas tepidiphila]